MSADPPDRCFARRPGVDRQTARHGNGTRPRRAVGRDVPRCFRVNSQHREEPDSTARPPASRGASAPPGTPAPGRPPGSAASGMIRGHRASRRPEGLPGRTAPEWESLDVDSAPRQQEHAILIEALPTRDRNLAGTRMITPSGELRSSQKEVSEVSTKTVQAGLSYEIPMRRNLPQTPGRRYCTFIPATKTLLLSAPAMIRLASITSVTTKPERSETP